MYREDFGGSRGVCARAPYGVALAVVRAVAAALADEALRGHFLTSPGTCAPEKAAGADVAETRLNERPGGDPTRVPSC